MTGIWKRKRKMRSLRGVLLPGITLGNLAVLIVGLVLVSFGAISFLRDEIGTSRVEMLQQISEVNQLNMNAMENTMRSLYRSVQLSISEESVDQFDGDKAEEAMQEANRYFSHMGVPSVVDIVFKNGNVYTSDDDMSRVVALKKTSWYTQLISAAKTESWYMNFSDREDSRKGIHLSLGRTIYDEKQNPVGILIISTSQKTLQSSYENALNEDNVIYILDQSGIVISHSNVNVIGFSFYYMPTFEKNVAPFDSYTLTTKQGKLVLISNYHNLQNKWTFVEELDFSSKLWEYSRIICAVLLAAFLCLAVMLGLNGVLINKITNSLTRFSKEIKNLQLDPQGESVKIPIQENYTEIKIITESFNKMLIRIQELIRDIKINESEKRRAEFDFLQAQIEPHFLRNTLLTLKSLIALDERQKAMSMLDDFNALLKIPMMVERQFVSVRDEIELVMHYMAIMEYRFDKKFLLRVEMDRELKHILIPRMILQPVVANAVFHGFAEKEDNAVVTIKVYQKNEDLFITITDNGEGMTKEQVNMIMAGRKNPNSHHGVGLQNVMRRLKLIYGQEAGFLIHSTENQGTRVCLLFPRYQSIYASDEVSVDENTGSGR